MCHDYCHGNCAFKRLRRNRLHHAFAVATKPGAQVTKKLATSPPWCKNLARFALYYPVMLFLGERSWQHNRLRTGLNRTWQRPLGQLKRTDIYSVSRLVAGRVL